MAIVRKRGDIWTTTCQVVVVPTNTTGAMGAGLAKQCKERYPVIYAAYMHLFKQDQLRINRPDLMNTCQQRHILLFPTKRDWHYPSKLDWVEDNLMWIRRHWPEGDLRGIKSMAIPPVGCGKGGLDIDMVTELIYDHLDDMELPVEYYIP